MTNTTRIACTLAALVLSLVSRSASAEDTWTTPFPGIRHLHRTGPPNVNINAAIIDLCAPGVSVRHTAFEERRQRTSDFARSVGAQWAINADFSCRPSDVRRGGTFAPCEGYPEYMSYSIAAHAGVPWPPSPFLNAVLAFAPGRVEIYSNGEAHTFEPWMHEVLSGHFDMVVGGTVYPFCGEDERPPRTVIGLSADRTQLITAVSDGRGTWSGRSCAELAALLIELGAWNGFNLDGGGSSTMWSAARGVLNHPSDDGHERVVGPHLAIYATGSGPSPFCDRPIIDVGAPLPRVDPWGPRGRLNSLPATRIFDTRDPARRASIVGLSLDGGGRVAEWSSFSFTGLPTSGVVPASGAAVVRITMTDQAAGGHTTVFPSDHPLPIPNVSTVNYAAFTDATNLALAGLGSVGNFSVQVAAPSHVVADLDGYFGPTGSGFFPETPRRILDTRHSTALVPGVERSLGVTAPPGTTALAINVATLGASSRGWLTLYPCGEASATGTAARISAGLTVSTALLARAGPAGLCAVADTSVHIIVDTTGSFAPEGGLDYQPLTPVREIETRTRGGIWFGRTESGSTAEIDLGRIPGYPDDAQAIAINVTSVMASEPGFLSFYPCVAGRPEASSMNYAAGANVANAVIVGTGDGRLCVYVSARTHLLVDVMGVFVPPPPPATPPPAMADPGVEPPPELAADAGVRSSDAAVPGRSDAAIRGSRLTGGCACVVASSAGDAHPRTMGVALGLALAWLARRRRASFGRVR